MSKFRTFFCFFIILLLFVSGCETQSRQKHVLCPDTNLSVTDFRGKQLCFQQPVERIVVLIESSLSALYMLGAHKHIVGIPSHVYQDAYLFESYASLDERIARGALSAPGNWSAVNVESVVALKPDIVIIWLYQQDIIEILEQRGILVYAVMMHRFEDVHKLVHDLGIITGREQRSQELLSFVDNELDTLHQLVKQTAQRPSVYFMWAQGMYHTSGSESTVEELLRLSGATNACLLPQEHVVVGAEQILNWNPDCIVMWENQLLDPEHIREHEIFGRTRAGQSDCVVELPHVFECDFWTLKYVYAAYLVFCSLHPELCEVGFLQRKRQQIFQFLYDR